ncbi:MAG TPA: aminotransferase class IV [Chitinophagaceae bacterium]|nr:aminotransferase class IV [Chitinophagaceae bacterium]
MKSPLQGTFLFSLMPAFYIYNGKFFQQGENCISPDSRAFRYGDGLFETMVVQNNTLRLADLHFKRLFEGLTLLKFDIPQIFTPTYLQEQIINLVQKNKLPDARIRLSVFRGDGGLYDLVNLQPNYIIQCGPLPNEVKYFNEEGWQIDVYPLAQKSMDAFANIKSANYLPYVMAALFAREKQLNDCLIMNTAGRIADSTIANIFLIKGDYLFTPPLSEGCVAGVMRRFLIDNQAALNITIIEEPFSYKQLEEGDEMFLTNAAYGIRWVKQMGSKKFGNSFTKTIYQNLMRRLHFPQLSG